MPLYEYQCDAGHRFELIRKFSDPPLDKCPTCGEAVRKLFSSPAIQFKGSGFYITDYGKKDQATAAQPNESKSDVSSKEKDKGEKHEKSGKTDKADKTGPSETSGKSDTGSAAASSSSSKESASSANSTKDSPKSKSDT